MKYSHFFCIVLFSAIFVERGLCGPTATSATPEKVDDEDEDFDEEDSAEADDDGRVYKNPRNSPSSECPRDEEQATLLGQKCLRKCSSDEDCKSKKKKCLCDGACGMSCIKPDRECPELQQPPLGTVVMSGRTFGSRASYTCTHGYHVVGLQSRLCQAFGHWSGTEPACKQNIYCLAPPTIEHARHSALPEQATFDLDSTVQYHCFTGYATAGFPRAKCLAIDGQASWYGPDISCEPRTCGQPTDPAHGWHAGECYTFGCRITYHCGDGYELVGKQASDCQADGYWLPKELPTCVLVTAVQCPSPENPRNGKAIYTSVSYNSVVSYECRYGYTLVGESSRRCGADKKWSGGLPVCKEINCGPPGTLYNGWLENTESGWGLGASIIFRCQPEMFLQGNTSTVCQIDGRWRYALPLCLAPCVVPTISQGIVSPIEVEIPEVNTTNLVTMPTLGIGSSKVRHSTILDVICDEHYEFPLTSLAPPTCNNGTWSVIPRCVPARCKTLPKPPKFGMVISPKTEHGMRARFKCKDGWQLNSALGKPITDSNEYVLTCSFGNWTGETPTCQEVYCQFPGYIPNGKVLLVGNMGLYDYRPYVKKVINNKQIMYDCDKGYVLENGPISSGATCIGGKWSPAELPECLPGQHPRLRWNRKKRSVDLKFMRANFLLNHYRHLKRLHYDHMLVKDFVKTSSREKRSLIDEKEISYRGRRGSQNHKIVKREARDYSEGKDYSEIERAYSKYYEKIKARYRNYVKNLLGYPKTRMNNMANNSYPLQEVENTKKIQVQDGRWYPDNHKNPEHLTRYRATHKSRTVSNDLQNEDIDSEITMNNPSIALSSVTEQRSNKYEFFAQLNNENMSNHFPSYSQHHNENNPRHLSVNNAEGADNMRKSNYSSIIAQLQSQIVRKKRQSDDEPKNSDEKEEQTDEKSGKKKEKFKGPCEALVQDSIMQIEVMRPSKDSNEEFGPGMIIKMTCSKGYNSNLANLNSTVKCVRGRWKPMKPICVLSEEPCFVPSVLHGKYFAMPSADPLIEQIKPTISPLTAMDKIDSGLTIAFQCDSGYNIQGPGNLKCSNGEWAGGSSPECLPGPCVLPPIMHASYQGGYRAGLTIAHGSSVMVQCESGMGTTPPVQMDCALGSLTPPSIQCGFAVASRKSRDDDESTNFILDGGNLTSSMEESDGRECGPPAKDQTMLIYRNEESTDSEDSSEEVYPAGTEISFNCIISVTGERTTWKIVCEDGAWIGRAHECGDDERLYNTPLANGSCIFRNSDPHVANFYNDLEIRENYVEFPPGTVVISRCIDIGKYMMIGSSNRTCIRSRWSGQKPHCYGLNQENDYAMEKPPTILFRHENGPISQSNDGKLIVYPGATIHMECLWMRRFGNPKWNVSHENKKYTEGWSADEGRDNTLEYRLSVINAEPEDSGTFSCMTPARHTHSIELVVKAVHCNEIIPRRGLALSTTATQMGTKVQFSCNNGNALIGAHEITCLPSGNWSGGTNSLPVCESVECGEPSLPSSTNGSTPRVAIISREVGGRAAFSCPSGHGLRGPAESICLPTGEWQAPFPTCSEVQCFHPGQVLNGYTQGIPPYKAGDVVQFNCNPEFMMQGQPIVACQDNGRWSGPLPKCVTACSYPGTAISGRMSSVKFYYGIGESVTFSCDNGLEIRGAKMLKCLKNGKWSNAIPQCVNPDAVNSRSK